MTGTFAIRPALAGLCCLTCALCAVQPTQAQYTETVLHAFGGAGGGLGPIGDLIRYSAGNLYGTTEVGVSGGGTVYRLDTASRLKALHTFTGPDGFRPYAGVVEDPAGNLYGTTFKGGPDDRGEVYKLDGAGNFTVLYGFSGGADGGYPLAAVVLDSAGNLYGTAQRGLQTSGRRANGVIYKLNPKGSQTVLYTFKRRADGAHPGSAPILDAAGNLYGTTLNGGAADLGVVYKLGRAGHLTVLHSFTGGADGAAPKAGVIRDSAGNFYGTTALGGAANVGVVYKLDTAGHESVLCSFTGGNSGAYPRGGVILDAAGNLYGTTSHGGAYQHGVVYKVTPLGQETAIYSFRGRADGGEPWAGLIQDPSGNLYGTTIGIGPSTVGTLFRIDETGHETVLYRFNGGPGGAYPAAGITLDAAGNQYGTTQQGGRTNQGVVYKLDPAGRETVLHSFTGRADGDNPRTGVVLDSTGNLYGTTLYGGTANLGVIYKLDAAGHETVLHSFTGGAGGDCWCSTPIVDSAGNLYGTTQGGGAASHGVLYKLDTAGNFTVLHAFTDGYDLGYQGVFRDPSGNLYGTTNSGGTLGNGAVWKLDTHGDFTVLYSFTGGADGWNPEGGVVLDSAGNLYGTTVFGGSAPGLGLGVVYELGAAGQYTVLHSFTGATGDDPMSAGVTLDRAGNLYGTTSYGGTGSSGVVYEIDTNGNYTVLYNFPADATGGMDPGTNAVPDAAGNLYGVTYLGGPKGAGVVFKLYRNGVS